MGAGSMTTHVELRPGAFADSVTLLQVSRAVQGLPGVAAAQVAMATPLNLEVLAGMGFEIPDEATPNDLVVALRLDDSGALGDVLTGVEQALSEATRRPAAAGAEEEPPRTTAAALRDLGQDALVVVSVAGANALPEAMDAVDAGRDVMIFSDNVPVEQEVALKRAAAERGVLVMGPDCGTAVVDGVGLGFANVVSPGPVGLVAASGTGCQQLLALLDHAGVGVGQALGVGGRDLSGEVGGLATREALRRLDADPAVELIVLISKPPAPEVAGEITAYADGLATPVELALLGPGQPDLTAAAERVLGRLGRDVPQWPVVSRLASSHLNLKVSRLVAGAPRTSTTGARISGLFVGGTLCQEARLIAEAALGPEAGTFVDFGEDEYTRGRAHPMIDPTLRLEELARVGSDPDAGLVLLDVVLGHGAEPDPAALLAPAVAALPQPVVVTVVGTAADPQDRDRQVRTLADAGAEVHLSNALATRRAVELLGGGR
jgi:FdrA protein